MIPTPSTGSIEDAARRAGLQIQRTVQGQLSATEPDGVRLIKASSIEPEPIDWLWPGWLALGKFHLLAGSPGQGKTSIALNLVAGLSRGRAWPDGAEGRTGSALIWSGEDDPTDTLTPRLMAMDADRERVFFVGSAHSGGQSRPFDLVNDLSALGEAIRSDPSIKLIVLDPVVSAITGDSHKNSEVRRSLQPLVDLAASLRVAVLGITHLSKGTAGRDPTERINGSVAFTAVARVVMLAGRSKDENGEERRILARSKSNIGSDQGGVVYRLEELETRPGIVASAIRWGESLNGSARELLREPSAEEGKTATEREAAEDWLRELLADGKPIASKTIQQEATNNCLSWATVRRASKSLGIEARKEGMHGGWTWTLPPEDAQLNPKALTQNE